MILGNPALTRNNQQIDWVLSHPGMSPWLKEALTAARDRDPIDVLNDLEILNYLLQTRSNTRILSALEKRRQRRAGGAALGH